MLCPISSCNIWNLFLNEFMLICANINLLRFLSLISCKSLKLCARELSLSELPLSSTSGQDISLFGEELQSKTFLEKLPATCYDLWKLLIFLMKLIGNLPKPLLFKCNPPRLNPALLMLLLSMMSSCSGSVDKCWLTFLTVSEALVLSVLKVKLEIQTLQSGKSFWTNAFKENKHFQRNRIGLKLKVKKLEASSSVCRS